MASLHCPQCGSDMKGDACSSCTYSRAAKVTSLTGAQRGGASRDVDWWRCCHVDRGQRCAEAGSISPSTHGTGPWFCYDHYSRIKGGSASKQAGPKGGFTTMRDAVRQATPLAAAPELPDVDTYEADAERAAIQGEDDAA